MRYRRKKKKQVRIIKTPKKINYQEYIVSEKWFYKREEVFKRKGKKCQKCKSTERLHVHHATYINLGKEDVDKDLFVLCYKCHELYHELIYGGTTIKKTLSFLRGGIKNQKHLIKVKPIIPKFVEDPDEKYRKFAVMYNLPFEEAKTLYNKLR